MCLIPILEIGISLDIPVHSIGIVSDLRLWVVITAGYHWLSKEVYLFILTGVYTSGFLPWGFSFFFFFFLDSFSFIFTCRYLPTCLSVHYIYAVHTEAEEGVRPPRTADPDVLAAV